MEAGASLDEAGFIEAGGHALEYRFFGPQPDDAPTLVLLHEGLGCAGLWLDFPQALSAATACGVFAFSRAGYGKSSPAKLPRPVSYMHVEARDIVPAVLDAIGMRNGLLIGHSDGASIAAIYAGSHADPRIAGISLMAPHFIIEDISIRSIAEAKKAYEEGNLRERLARWHQNVDVAFRGWNDAWLNPAFHDWDITEYLPYIRIPLQIIQGVEDQYGTIRQVEIAQEECSCPVEATMLEGVKHSPFREAQERTVSLIADFCARAIDASRSKSPVDRKGA